MKRLALFDFDGTLTTRDTLLEFLKFYAGTWKYYFGMALLLPVLIAYKLKIIRNWVAKEKVITYFLRGEHLERFRQKGAEFTGMLLPGMLRKEAIDRLKWHQEKGDRIIVVSASAREWIEPWTEGVRIELVSTRLEVSGDRLTGKIKGRNCYGREKENRIREYLDVGEYDRIFAYGDSRGDLEMLAMSTDPYFRKFS